MYKILIRPLERVDALISWKWRNDSDIWEFTGSKPDLVITPEIEINWIEKVLLDPNSKRFAIIVDDIYVGNIQITNITQFDAEYHIFIGEKSYWGKGLAFSATQQIVRFAKNSLMLDYLYLKVIPNNIKAIKLYEKCGFEIVSDEVKMVLSLEKTIKPMVSIFCMVYNHENYLRLCLDSFLMQKCNFDYEIVVGEDCSTDNSRGVLLEYNKKYPGKFKLLLNEINVGAVCNQNALFERCTGKYIAMCEGDDYWTDPLKLQKQVKFLDENEEFSMCFSSVNILDSCEDNFFAERPAEDREYNIDELLLTKFAHTATYFFRKKLLNTSIFMQKNMFAGDLFLLLSMAEKGKVYGFSDVMAVYRKHIGGITKAEESKLGIKHYERFVKQFILVKKTFHTISKKSINTKIVDNSITVFLYYAKRKKIIALKFLILALYYQPNLIFKGLRKIILR